MLRRTRLTFALFILNLLTFPILSHAATIVVLQGTDSPFNRRYFSGFSSIATERVTAFRYDAAREAGLLTQIKRLAPDLIFTIGQVPVKRLADTFSPTPMIVSQEFGEIVTTKPNVILLQDQPMIRSTLELTQILFPERKTIGTIYNPKLSQNQFEDLVAEAGKVGMKVASLKVDSPADVKTLINAIVGKMDLFYWTRDTTTAAPGSVATIFEFAEKNNIPIVTPDPDQIEKGAILAVSEDPFRLGERAWEISKAVLKDKKFPSKAPSMTITAKQLVHISIKTTAKFGIGADPLYAFFQKALSKEGYSVQLLP